MYTQYLQYKSPHDGNNSDSSSDSSEDSITKEEQANLFSTPSKKNKLRAVKIHKMVSETLLFAEPKNSNKEQEEINNIQLEDR